ncbi:general stress protein [Planococcus sp. 1R117A]|uniref:general stress protein n=1 Tax=Planococcus sp. 1R117A TaxID=3447020 RepID=UPI003EDB7AA6
MSKVVGSYHSENEAISAIEDLKRKGYRSEDISVLSKDKKEIENVTGETGTHAGEGAATGAVTGGALGGLGGVLAGIGALAIPGIGPIVAAGPIVAGLTGAAAGAGVGGLTGALIGLGIPEDEAQEYETQFNEGRILVLVDDNSSAIPDHNDRDAFISGSDSRTGVTRETYISDQTDTTLGRDSIINNDRDSRLGNDRDSFTSTSGRDADIGSTKDAFTRDSDSGITRETYTSDRDADTGLIKDSTALNHNQDPLIGSERSTTTRGDKSSPLGSDSDAGLEDDLGGPNKRGQAGL